MANTPTMLKAMDIANTGLKEPVASMTSPPKNVAMGVTDHGPHNFVAIKSGQGAGAEVLTVHHKVGRHLPAEPEAEEHPE